MIDAISFNDSTLRYLDQRYLPLRENHVATKDYREAIEAIKTLAVRGAPLIGVAAAYTIILGINSTVFGGMLDLACLFFVFGTYIALNRRTMFPSLLRFNRPICAARARRWLSSFTIRVSSRSIF